MKSINSSFNKNNKNFDNRLFPFVSIVICTYNGEKNIDNSVKSALNQNYPKEKLEIIVVDDGSTDKTFEIIKKYAIKIFRHKVNKGLATARNTGITNANGEIVCFTDDDCIVDQNWILNLTKYYGEGIIGVGGRNEIYKPLTILDKFHELSSFPLYVSFEPRKSIKDIILRFFGKPVNNPPYSVESLSLMGCNSSYLKKVLLSIGGCDPSLRRGVDVDLNRRLKKAYPSSKFIYTPDAVVYHKPRSNFTEFMKHQFEYGKAHVFLFFKYGITSLIPPPIPFLFYISLLLLPFNLNFIWVTFVVLMFGLVRDLPHAIKTSINQKDMRWIFLLPILDNLRQFAFFTSFLYNLAKILVLKLFSRA